MRIVVITGINGSGKTTALRALEDLGYYAIDNLPIALLDRLIELFDGTGGEFHKLVLVADSRGAHDLRQIPEAIDRVRRAGHDVDVLFMDASDEVVARRYSETRRVHPLAAGHGVAHGIQRERLLLEPLREAATIVLDTSAHSVHDTKRDITKLFSVHSGPRAGMSVTLISFGYRHGVPSQADLVFDVRFLPNPYFVDALRPLTGRDDACARYVLEGEKTRTFLAKIEDLLGYLLPAYEDEGKAYLTIAVGCTGGRHRSVAIAQYLADWIRRSGRDVTVRHRDVHESNRPPSVAPTAS